MMNHDEITAMIPDYLGGGLNDREKQALFLHLTECEECRRELREMLLVKRAAEAIARPCPDALLQNAFRSVRKEKKEEKTPLNKAMDSLAGALSLVRSTIKLALN